MSDDPAGAAAALLAGASGHVCITGGSTPRKAYERVAAERPDWSGVDVWFTDERCVPPDHEHSNFRMANEALLSRVSGATVHRMQGELGPERGAAEYEREYEAAGRPVLDLILLGIGPDVHTCSLFPGDDALAERERPVVGVETPGMAPLVSRITLTLPGGERVPADRVPGDGGGQGGRRGRGVLGTARPARTGLAGRGERDRAAGRGGGPAAVTC